jgi:hypothetical protein
MIFFNSAPVRALLFFLGKPGWVGLRRLGRSPIEPASWFGCWTLRDLKLREVKSGKGQKTHVFASVFRLSVSEVPKLGLCCTEVRYPMYRVWFLKYRSGFQPSDGLGVVSEVPKLFTWNMT